MAINQEFLTTLKDKINIVEVAQGYLNLEKRGGGYWACCPFHHEKTPSFCLNEAGNFYHCFGCGASGDVIKFVSSMENTDFVDTVKMLAERAKLPIPQTEFDSEKTIEQKRKRDALYKIMKDCAHFYLDNLYSGKADAHLEYINSRKIPPQIVRQFGLGASLNFSDLPTYLLQKGYSRRDIIDSGAVNEVDGRLSDAQGGRLVFPIINALDEVIAFGGRALKKVEYGKYKNTKETLIFNKSKNLYNINRLKKLKREQTVKNVIMVEGYMDTISLYQAGFKNVVASMGTSLTQEQARLIKRYTDTVLISYDGDAAGQKANMRGLEILKGEGLNVKVVPLPEGLDPDDVIKQLGAEAYQTCLNNALPLIDYKINTIEKGYDLSKTEDKRQFVAEAIKIVRTADSATEQEELLKGIRDKTGITYESLSRDLGTQKATPKPENTQAVVTRTESGSAAMKASRFVIASYLFGAKYADGNVKQIAYACEAHKMIAGYIYAKQLMEEHIVISELFSMFEENTAEYEEFSRVLDYSNGDKLKGEVAEKTFSDCMRVLELNSVDEKIFALKNKISAADDTSERARIGTELTELIKLKDKIKNGVR